MSTECVRLVLPAAALQAALVTTGITQVLSCIVVNLGARFWQGRRTLVNLHLFLFPFSCSSCDLVGRLLQTGWANKAVTSEQESLDIGRIEALSVFPEFEGSLWALWIPLQSKNMNIQVDWNST